MSKSLEQARVAIVHDWLVSQRGGENVLDAICELFPKADLYTLVHKEGSTSARIEGMHPHPSLLQKIPGIEKRYPYFLAVMPLVARTVSTRGYDLVLSSSHCVAKGVPKSKGALHVSYIHAPMRYMWDRFDEYFSAPRAGLLTRTVAGMCRPYLQAWDKHSAKGVDHIVANSQFIAGRIREIYGRDAKVVYPFCDWQRFVRPRKPTAAYLIVTALVPYKRVDLAIEAFNSLGKELLIVGDGPDRKRLEAIAGPKIKFLGAQSGEDIAELYSKAKGLIFPGVEDFGIVPLEAMAAGLPVIAFGRGGALETVVDGKTGVFFHDNSAKGLIDAINRFEATTFDEEVCRRRAQGFGRDRFHREYYTQVQAAWDCHQSLV